MKEYWWVRKLLYNGEYYYLYVVKEAAIQIYAKTGFEIRLTVVVRATIQDRA